MSMAQQTAINWLREKLQETYDKERKLPLAYTFSLLNKAEQMEKEQQIEIYRLKAIIEFYEQGCKKEGCKATEPHVH